MLIGQVWKSPDVCKAHSQAHHGEEVLPLIGPVVPLMSVMLLLLPLHILFGIHILGRATEMQKARQTVLKNN